MYDYYAGEMYNIEPINSPATISPSDAPAYLPQPKAQPNAISISPNGKYIAVGTDQNIDIYTEQEAQLKDFDSKPESNKK